MFLMLRFQRNTIEFLVKFSKELWDGESRLNAGRSLYLETIRGQKGITASSREISSTRNAYVVMLHPLLL